jgi:hypothetical protein
MATDGSTSQKGNGGSIEELLKSLNLKEEDIEGVFVKKSEVDSLKEGTRWMAVMRLHVSKPFSAQSLKKTLSFTWAPAQEVTFRDLEENKFMVQANCLGDWRKITEQGPWIFRDHGLLVEKYDGSCRATAVELNRIHAWVQIHDVPEMYRKKQMITSLVVNIGEVIAVDMNISGGEQGDFVRVRVWLDVRRSLTRFVSFKPEGDAPVVMRVKYEKIPRFCAVCGLLGHEKEECGSGVHDSGKEGYGKWLLADTPWNRSQLYGTAGQRAWREKKDMNEENAGGRGHGREGRGGGRMGGREGGRGRGGSGSSETRKRTSTEALLTEGSPIKGGGKEKEVAAPLLLQWKEPGVIITEQPEAQGKLDLDRASEKEYQPRAGTPPPPPSSREQKRSRKHSTPKKSVTAEATSGSGDRQSK